MTAKTVFYFHFQFSSNYSNQNQKSPLQIQDSCVHTNQHCYINTPGLQHLLNTDTQFIFINKNTNKNTNKGLKYIIIGLQGKITYIYYGQLSFP